MSKNRADLVAYCGLYCGDCPNYTGRIADLARDLRRELRVTRFDRAAPVLASFSKPFQDYDKCYATLGAMVKMRCRQTCRQGGHPWCAISTCAQRKGYEGCWLCSEFEECGKMGFLKKVHGDAHLKNLRIIRKRGKAGFLAGKSYW